MEYFIIALILLAILLIFIATRPSEFKVERSAIIKADPVAVFSIINDLHKWESWSPWARLDPDAQNTIQGTGVGSSFAWDGNNKVGKGIMTITESNPYDLVRLRLEFFRPFKAVNTTTFKLTPEQQGTSVLWTMYGRNNFISKAMSLFIDCDKMVGKQFEQGLENMNNSLVG